MKFFYALLSFSLITISAKAQHNFRSGYIVGLAGDTTHGEINYKGWANNPSTILFRSSGNNEMTEYGTAKIVSFGINGQENYSRYRVNISTNDVDVANLPIGIDTSFIKEEVFLQKVITDPKISLFTYRDKLKTRYYIAENNGQPYELEYRVYRNIEDSLQVVHQYKFRTQLLIVASKFNLLTDDLKLKVSKAQYRSSDIINIISELGGIDLRSEDERRKSVGRFFVGLGVNKAGIRYEGQNDLLIAPNMVYTSSVTPGFVFGYDRVLDQSVGDLLLRFDLTFSAAHTKLFFDHNNPSGDHLVVNSSVKQYTASLSPQILYNFYNTTALKFYVNGGLSGNFSTYSYKYSRQSKGGSYQTDQYPQLEKLWLSFPVRIGVELSNKIGLYAGYQFPVSIGSRAGYSANVRSISAGFNYLFNRSK